MVVGDDRINSLAHSWLALALRGLAAIVFGILAYTWPGLTMTVLVLLFGIYALLDAVFALVGAGRARGGRRGALMLEGLVGVAAGALVFLWPFIAAVALVYVIAAWAIVTGVLEIIAAVRLRREIEGEWFLLFGGALSVAFGLAIGLWPAAGLLAVTWLIGAYAILFGFLLMLLAFRVRHWDRWRAVPA